MMTDAAVERGDRSAKPARRLKMNYVVSPQVVAQAGINGFRRIKLHAQAFRVRVP